MSSVVDTMIPSAAFGAEAAGVPAVIVMHGPYIVPRAEVPPLGTGFMPRQRSLGRLRDRPRTALAWPLPERSAALNQARAEFRAGTAAGRAGLMRPRHPDTRLQRPKL